MDGGFRVGGFFIIYNSMHCGFFFNRGLGISFILKLLLYALYYLLGLVMIFLFWQVISVLFFYAVPSQERVFGMLVLIMG